MIFSLFVDGLSVGSVYALVAVGLVMVDLATGIINFAHGDIMMFSTFVAYSCLIQFKLPLIISFAIALIAGASLGFLSERFVVRRILSGPMANSIMATLGIAYILQGLAKNLWSDDLFHFPEFFPGSYIQISSSRISPQSLGVIITTFFLITFLYLFLNRTKQGIALRAITQNRQAAALLGINVPKMFSFSWIVGGILAAFAGILLAPSLFLSTGMGSITFTGIIAAIIGGYGNIYGAIIGGYLLGIVTSLLPLVIPTELQGILPFLLLMFVLFIRPSGLIGKSIVKKV